MCGRYVASRRADDLGEEFDVDRIGDGPADEAPGADPAGMRPDYNVAPTKAAPVVLERPPLVLERPPRRGRRSGGAAPDLAATSSRGPGPDVDPKAGPDVDPKAGPDIDPDAGQKAGPDAVGPVRWLRLLTWGLVPSWAKDRSVGNRMINARAETLLDRPAYRRAALARRCLIPADGWYEWQRSPTEVDAKGKPRKQPFFMHPHAGGPIALAGVYELWRPPAGQPEDPAAWLATFAVITTGAEPGLDVIHDRMPLVLPRDRWDDWLDPDLRDPDAVRALLRPPRPGGFLATAVTTRVNAVANNGPELIEPAPVDQLRGVVDPATGELIGGGDVALW